MKDLERLPKFIHQCMTIGEIPTSYKVSLTYEEQLMWFCKFLQDEVIPVVNNNSQAVQELQTFIENYFENLDVQEEIDNKLEEMLESGELAEIITEYLQINGVLAYNTVSDIANAENIVNGSICKTLGELNYLDGKGRFYKIREITNDDTIDGVNIISIVSDPTNTLIAELIPEQTLTEIDTIKTNITTLTNRVDLLSSRKYIFIGDSYNNDYGDRVAWYHSVVTYLGLTSSDYYQSGVDGAGFVHGTTFLTQLQTLSASITNKNEITDILVCGGVNDMTESLSDLYTALGTFATYCATNYPNAKVHIGMISWSKADASREFLNTAITYYNSASIYPNVNVIGNAFLPIHVYNLYLEDGHPNESGTHQIAMYLANYLKGGKPSVNWNRKIYAKADNTSIISTPTTTRIINIMQYMNDGNITVEFGTEGYYLELNGTTIQTDIDYKIANIEDNNEQLFWFNGYNNTLSEGIAYIMNSSNAWSQTPYVISTNGKGIYIKFRSVASGGTISFTNGSRLYLQTLARSVTYNANMC